MNNNDAGVKVKETIESGMIPLMVIAAFFAGFIVGLDILRGKAEANEIPAEAQTRALVVELIDEIETMRKECGE